MDGARSGGRGGVGIGQAAGGARIVEWGGLRLRRDPADEPREHASRADLDEPIDAGGPHGRDGRDPVDAGGEVVDQLRTAGVGRGERPAVGIREERDSRRVELDAGAVSYTHLTL